MPTVNKSHNSGNKSHNWKGSDTVYSSKHTWIRNNHGAANKCEMKDETCSKCFQWSNKNHKYSRNMKDWQQLCASHHKRYDFKKFSQVSYWLGYRKYTDRECEYCKKPFYPKKVNSKFCSKSCNMYDRNRKILNATEERKGEE